MDETKKQRAYALSKPLTRRSRMTFPTTDGQGDNRVCIIVNDSPAGWAVATDLIKRSVLSRGLIPYTMGINSAGLAMLENWYFQQEKFTHIWIQGVDVAPFSSIIEKHGMLPADCSILANGDNLKSFDANIGARIVSPPVHSDDPLLAAMSYAIEFLRYGKVIAMDNHRHSYYEWKGAIKTRRSNRKGICYAKQRIFWFSEIPDPLDKRSQFSVWPL